MSVIYVEIEDADDAGQRLDNFLLRTLKGVPRQHIYKLIRRGEVRVNGGRAKAAYRIQLADRIRIPPVNTRAQVQLHIPKEKGQFLLERTLHEDDNYLIINKPAGTAVHGGSSVSAGVVEILRAATDNPRLELVHRLDRGTSGCLVLAKSGRALKSAQAAFRNRQVKKIYELIVWGQWPANVRTVQLKLQRYETAWGERRVRVDHSGQSARTDFELLEIGPVATRLRARLHTGRTHQIRVHAHSSGHGVVGDDKYGATEAVGNADFRLCLHASRVHLPTSDGILRIDCPVDGDMRAVWQRLLECSTQV